MSAVNYNNSRRTSEIHNFGAFKFTDWVDTQTPDSPLSPEFRNKDEMLGEGIYEKDN